MIHATYLAQTTCLRAEGLVEGGAEAVSAPREALMTNSLLRLLRWMVDYADLMRCATVQWDVWCWLLLLPSAGTLWPSWITSCTRYKPPAGHSPVMTRCWF